jgi:MFS transporter, DHA1 family, multidrug resistance protein
MLMKLPGPSFDVPRRTLFLSGGIFVLSICSFMIVPLLALYLARELHTPTGEIGIVLAVMAFANQGLQVLVGVVSDRVGSRMVFSAGVVAVSLGYIGFALGPPFPLQVLCGFSLGIGRATISLLSKVLLISEAGDKRASALTLRSVAVNAGSAIGPVIGALLFASFVPLLVAVVVVHALFWLALIRIVSGRQPRPSYRPGLRQELRMLLANRALLSLTGASVGFWYLYTQLTFTFPLYADDRFHLGGRVGLLFALNAVLAVLLQYGAIAWLGRRFDGWTTLTVGCAVVGVAFLPLWLISSVWALVLFVVLFSLGEIVVVPTLDIVTSDVASASSMGSSFGFASLGWALGGVLGSALGGAAYQAASAPRFWLLNVAVGIGTALAFLVLRSWFRQPTPAPARLSGIAEPS